MSASSRIGDLDISGGSFFQKNCSGASVAGFLGGGGGC